jgi:hypothetical protein
MTNEDQLTERYVALWNEPDPDRRRDTIRELWTEDGSQVLEPPEEMRSSAAAIGFLAPRLESRGYHALEARVTRAYEDFVGSGQFRFRARANAARLDDVVKFNWEMVPAEGGEVAAVGLDVLILAPDGRIRVDYQFIES